MVDVPAVVVAGILSVFPFEDGTETLVASEAVAVEQVTARSNGVHAFVLADNFKGSALLEVSLFQMRRPQFSYLPEMVLLHMLVEASVELLNPNQDIFSIPFVKAATWRSPEPCPQCWHLDVVLAIARERTDWSKHDDADPGKANAVANRIMQAHQA